MAGGNYQIKAGVLLDFKNIQSQLNAYGKGLKLNLDTGNLGSAQKDLKNLGSVYERTGKKINTTSKQATSSFVGLKSGIAGGAASFVDITKKVVLFGASTKLISGVGDAVKGTVGAVYELDSALTELKKVSELRGEGLAQFTDQAYEAGKQAAKTGKEIIQASTEFVKAGYSEQDSLDLSVIASKFQNIADTEINAGDAAAFIISQMKAFKIEAADAVTIIDKVNEVANNFALGTNDLQLALTKTGSALGTVGNSIDQTIGLVTAGTEIMVRQPSKVGRGLRTIAINISKLAKENKTWKDANGKVNVSLRDQNGELRSTYEIMKDLKPQWDKLTNAEKTNLAQGIAGKNQFEVFTAVLNNFGKAVEATETAMDSAGSADKENEAVLESIEGHLQRLKSAWEDFARQTLSSDTVKAVLNVGTAIGTYLASPAGQAAIQLTLLATTTGLLFRAFSKLGAAVKGLSVIEALTKLWLGSARATDKDTAATVRNTAAKVKNASATTKQAAANATAAKTQAAATRSAAGVYKGGKAKPLVAPVPKGTTSSWKSFGGVLGGVFGSIKTFAAANPLGVLVAGFAGFVGIVNKLTTDSTEAIEAISGATKQLGELDTKISKLERKEAKGTISKTQQARLDAYRDEAKYLDDIIEKNYKAFGDNQKNAEKSQIVGNRGKATTDGQTNENLKQRDNYLVQIAKTESQIAALKRKANNGDEKAAKNLKKRESSLRTSKDAYTDINKTLKEQLDIYDQMYKNNPEKLAEAPQEVQDAYQRLIANTDKIQAGLKGNYTEATKFGAALDAVKTKFENYGAEAAKNEAANLTNLFPDAQDLAQSEQGIQTLTDRLETYNKVLEDDKYSARAFNDILNDLNAVTGEVKLDKKGRFIADPAKAQEEAAALNLTKEAYQQLLDTMSNQGYVNFKFNKDTINEATAAIKNLNDGFTTTDGRIYRSKAAFREWTTEQGYTISQSKELQKALQDNGITFTNWSGKAASVEKQLKGLGDDFGVVVNQAGNIENVNLDKLVQTLKETGATNDEIENVVNTLNNLENVEFEVNTDSAHEMVETWGAALEKLPEKAQEEVKSTQEAIDSLQDADYELEITTELTPPANELLTPLEAALTGQLPKLSIEAEDNTGPTINKIRSEKESVGEPVTTKFDADTSDADQKIDKTKGKIDAVPNSKTVTVSVNTGGAISAIDSLVSKIKNIPDVKPGMASGGLAKGGKTLVGEEGPELVQSGAQAYVVGAKGAEIANLKKGDRVFNAQDTAAILSGGHSSEVYPAFANGTEGDSAKLQAFASGSKKKKKKPWEKELEKWQKKFAKIEIKLDISELKGANGKKLSKQAVKIQKQINKEIKTLRKKGLKNGSQNILELRKQALEYKKKAIEYLNQYYEAKKNKQQLDLDLIKAKNGSETSQIKQTNKLVKTSEQQIRALKKKGYKESSAEIKQLRLDIQNYYNDIKELEREKINKARDNNNAELDMLDYLADQRKKEIDAQIKGLEEQKKILQEEADLQEEQIRLAEIQNRLAGAANKKVRVYTADGGFSYMADPTEVAEAQKDLDDYYREKAIDDLDKQIDALEEQKDAYDELIDAQKERIRLSELELALGKSYAEFLREKGLNSNSGFEAIANAYASIASSIIKWNTDERYLNALTSKQVANGELDKIFRIPTPVYADGTTNAKGGLSLVGEQGPELRVLNSGDGVLTTARTKGLMQLADNAGILSTKLNNIDQGERTINVTNNFRELVLPNVTNGKEFVDEVSKLRGRMIQRSGGRR